MSNLEILEDLLEKYQDPEKQIYDLELDLLKGGYSYYINIFYFIHYLIFQKIKNVFSLNISFVEKKNNKFVIGSNIGMLRRRSGEKAFKPILYDKDIIEFECSNIFKKTHFELSLHTWSNHLLAIINNFGIFYLILGLGTRVSLKLKKPSLKRMRAEGLDGAGFDNTEAFLHKRFTEISNRILVNLNHQQNELSETSEFVDIFFDSRKTFEEHLSYVWKTKNVIQIIFMMDLSLLPVNKGLKHSFFNYKYIKYTQYLNEYKKFLLKNLMKQKGYYIKKGYYEK